MYPSELDLLVRQERHRDRLYRAQQARLWRAASPSRPGVHRLAAAWVGGILARLGLTLPGRQASCSRTHRSTGATLCC